MSTISRIGGGIQCSTIQAYPPAAMTTNVTNITTTTYGTGYYIATSSTDVTTSAYLPFNTLATPNATITGYFQGDTNTNSTTSPYTYNGTSVTTDVNNVTYSGVWLQIQLPYSIIVSSYYMSANANGIGLANTTPTKWWLLASKDGIIWTLISTVTGNNSASVSTNVSTITGYSYYRIIINSIILAGNPNYGVAINNLTFYGTQASLTVGADGELGVGITDPVQQLEVAGNAIIYGNISAGNLGMFRNRIINGSFMVDQRGSATTPVTTSLAYGPDRFLSGAAGAISFSISQYTMTTATDMIPINAGFKYALGVNTGTRSAGNIIDAVTRIELCNCYDIMTSTVTVSFWSKSSVAGQVTLMLQSSSDGTSNTYVTSSQNILLKTSWQYYVVQFAPTLTTPSSGAFNTIGMSFRFRATDGMPSGAINYYTGLQLEKGTIATPFEFRPYPVELQLCQRYYYQYTASATNKCFGALTNVSTTSCFGSFTFPVVMRTIPTLAYASWYLVYSALFTESVTSITLYSNSTQVTAYFQVATTNNQGKALGLFVSFAALNANAFIGFSAEL